MNNHQLQIAIDQAGTPQARAFLEEIQPLFARVCDLEREFAGRIKASKAARGERPPKLSSAKREEVAGYEKDAEAMAENLNRDLAGLSAESIVWALAAGLESDIAFWQSQGLRHTHPAERPIVEEVLQAKTELHRNLQEFTRRYRPEDSDES